MVTCEYGSAQATAAGRGSPTVAVVGDSKIAQWMPALQPIAERNGWRLVTYTKSDCGFHTAIPPHEGEEYTACVEWNQQVLARLTAEPRGLRVDLAAQPSGVRTGRRSDH